MAMDELEISGKRYISTRRAARDHGYHSDYMGQLIRGGKVVGQKVGRSWYIDEQSLSAYLNQEKEVQKQPEPLRVTLVAPAPKVAPEPTPMPVEKPEVAHIQTAAPQAKVQPAMYTPASIVPRPVEQVVDQSEHVVAITKKVLPEPEPLFVEEKVSYVPVTARMPQHMGGLRYAVDDAPLMPTPVRKQEQYPRASQMPIAPIAHVQKRRFPFMSLAVVGIFATLIAVFASNFVSATIVTEPGKSASVQYAIHW